MSQILDQFSILITPFIVSMTIIIVSNKILRCQGLYIFCIVAMIIVNTETIKESFIVDLDYNLPFANIIMVAIALVNNLTVELYGEKNALRNIYKVTISFFIFIALVIVDIGFTPYLEAGNNSRKLLILSTPLFLGSFVAYSLCSRIDITLFTSLNVLTKGKFLGLRHFVASSFGLLIDTIIFSFLSWICFIITPIPSYGEAQSYLNNIVIRIIFTIMSIPVFYYVRYSRKRTVSLLF